MALPRSLEELRGGVTLSAAASGVDLSPAINPFTHLARNAKTNPSGVFLETADLKVLNSDAMVSVVKLAYELRRIGVAPGDLVALDLPEALAITFTEAVFHEAAASTILPKGFVPDGGVNVDWIVTNVAGSPAAASARLILVDLPFLERVEQNPYGIRPREYPSSASLLRVVFSSGTTGRPNAIALTVGMLEAHSANALETWMQGDPFLVFLGTGTAMGFNAFYLSVQDGRPFLAVGTSDSAAIAALIERKSVTSLKASPAQVAGLASVLEASGRQLTSVDSIYIVGSVLSPTVATQIRQLVGGCQICNLYGSTEATIAFARYYDSDDPYDAGYLFPGSAVEIVDDDGQPVALGQVGRIRHRHPQMIHEYLGSPEATRAAFADGWFYPGDLGLIRADGGLTLAGRASEILNAGGVKIDPTQLDLFAIAHPGVVDAASFTYSSAAGSEQIGLALVTETDFGTTLLIEQLQREFGAASPQLVARIQAIPRNAMGKPMRLTLAEMHKGS